MGFLDVNWLQNASYTGTEDRQVLKGVIGANGSGVISPLSLKVTPSSGLTVSVAGGGAFCVGMNSIGQGAYYVFNDNPVTTTLSVSGITGGNSRIDTLCLQFNDSAVTGGANGAALVVVTGSPSSGSSSPTPPLTSQGGLTQLPLADITLTASTGTITTGMIKNRRALCGGLEHVGTIKPWPALISGASNVMLPAGYIACDGSSQSTSTYPELYELIGTTYGSGSGTFTLPPLNGRHIVGTGAAASGNSINRILGAWGGSEWNQIGATHLPPHIHTLGGHVHTVVVGNDTPSHVHAGAGGQHIMTHDDASIYGLVVTTPVTPAVAGGVGAAFKSSTNTASAPHAHSVSSVSGPSTDSGDGGFANTVFPTISPFLALPWIIKAA